MSYIYQTTSSPCGDILIMTTDEGICQLDFVDRATSPTMPPESVRGEHPHLTNCREQLAAYFAEQLAEFDLPLAAVGTAFQLRVWQALREIPYGATCSYGELARKIGKPTASRAVGAANGRNPIAIVVPCHRVIGADGTLTGYAGGIERKRHLLALESRQLTLNQK